MYDDNGMKFPADLSHQFKTSQNHERNNTDTVETYNVLGHSTLYILIAYFTSLKDKT